MYLEYAPPWWIDRNGRTADILAEIAAEQAQIVDQLGTLILERDGVVEMGRFPDEFTALHDLSSDFVVGRMLQLQQLLIALLEQQRDAVQQDTEVAKLIQQILAAAQRHLDLMEQLVAQPVNNQTAS
jgi:DNA polymerase III gamma/tau subunit